MHFAELAVLATRHFVFHQRSKLQLVKPGYIQLRNIQLSGYISGNLDDNLTVFV